jgi:hypothetical protein
MILLSDSISSQALLDNAPILLLISSLIQKIYRKAQALSMQVNLVYKKGLAKKISNEFSNHMPVTNLRIARGKGEAPQS